jgi:hypothetical protein
MGINFNDADGIEPELLQQAQNGEALMKSSTDKGNSIISPETVKKDSGGGGGGGGGGQKSIDQVIADAEVGMNVVSKTAAQGGFKSSEKDKFDLIQAHGEWVKARNENINCPDKIVKTSVRYTTLVNGKAGQNEIIKAHQDHLNAKETCNKSGDLVVATANNYIKVFNRVKENQLKEQNIYQVEPMMTNVEKFQNRSGSGSVIEGFNYYGDDDSYADNPKSDASYNQRLPRYNQSDKTTSVTDKSTLPWNLYYNDCYGSPNVVSCKNAHRRKDEYISTINYLFDQAGKKLQVYYNVAVTLNSQVPGVSTSLSNLVVGTNTVQTSLENQKKDIDLYKQQALYNYDQYNSLSFIEDMFVFVYYAVFVIFVYMSIRDFYSSYGGYDKRNIIILILLGVYPKYILKIVLWILNVLTEITRMLGLKNVSFWY